MLLNLAWNLHLVRREVLADLVMKDCVPKCFYGGTRLSSMGFKYSSSSMIMLVIHILTAFGVCDAPRTINVRHVNQFRLVVATQPQGT